MELIKLVMTPKEKAKELIDKFKGYADDSTSSCIDNARYIALLCVDEIISEYNVLQIETNFCYKMYQYWNEVKQEIEKL
jgi:hypothetical protein